MIALTLFYYDSAERVRFKATSAMNCPGLQAGVVAKKNRGFSPKIRLKPGAESNFHPGLKAGAIHVTLVLSILGSCAGPLLEQLLQQLLEHQRLGIGKPDERLLLKLFPRLFK